MKNLLTFVCLLLWANILLATSDAPVACKDHFSAKQYDWMRYFDYPEECPTALCEVPEIIFLDSTELSIEVAWAAFPEDSLYQIRYRNLGDTSWQHINLTTNEWRRENLKPCTKLEFQIRRACGAGFSAWSNLRRMTTRNCKDYYCAGNGGKSKSWINRFKFDSWEYTSGNNQGYFLYPNLALDLTSHKPYPLEFEMIGIIQPQDSLHWQIWIDKNLDGDFDDAGEQVYRNKSVQKNLISNPTKGGILGPKLEEKTRRIVHNGSFELPEDFKAGNSRMRVVLSLNKFVDSPCDASGSVLETEDYPITLRANPICAVPTKANLSFKNITSTGVVIKTKGLNAAGYQWILTKYTGSPVRSTDVLPHDSLYMISLTENTRYSIRLRVLCYNGNFSPWSDTVSFTTLPILCPSPDPSLLSVSKITHNSAQFSTGFQREARYYQFSYRIKGTTNWTESPVQKTTVANSEQLKSNTTYEYRSRIYCSEALATASPYSVTKTFLTLHAPCLAPNRDLIEVQLQGDTLLHLSYKDTSAIYSAYQWRYRKRGTSTWTTLEKGVAIVPNPEPGVTYELAVLGFCPSGLPGEWSTIKGFMMPCRDPKLSELALSYLGHTEAKIAYRGGKKNGFYWQYKRIDEASWSPEVYGVDTLITIRNLAPAAIYQFRLRTFCASLEWSNYSAAMIFTTPAILCPSPDQVTISQLDQQRTWVQCDQDGTTYTWRYRLAGSQNWIDSIQSDSARWVITGLAFPADYEIQTKIQCLNGQWSDWSSKTFSVPNLHCPTPSANQIEWELVPDSIYYLKVRASVYEEILWRYRKLGTKEWIMLADSMVRKEGLLVPEGTTSEISIRGVCGNSGFSAWSAPRVLNGPCDKVPLSNLQILKVGAQSVEIKCNVENIARFYWTYRVQGAQDWSSWIRTANDTLVLTDLKSETNYEIQVQRICGENHQSEFSESLNFTTPALLCTPLDVNLIDESRVTAHSAVVTYYGKEDAKGYVLAYREKWQNAGWTIAELYENTDEPLVGTYKYKEWQLGPLPLNTSYEYRIGVLCEVNQQMVWSEPRTFKTLPANFCPTPEPKSLAVIYDTPTQLRLDYPLRRGEALNWRYRQTPDTSWTNLPSGAIATLQLEPNQTYQISLQKTCIDRLVSDWSQPRLFYVRCQLNETDLEITNQTISSVEAKSKMEGQRYEWAYRRQGQGQWEKQSWSTTNQVSFQDLAPGKAYIMGLRIICYPGDTSQWVEQTFYTSCTSILDSEIQVKQAGPLLVRFECFNESYRDYEWRYRRTQGATAWTSANTIISLDLGTYEAQVRGACIAGGWSAWSEPKLFEIKTCVFPSSFSVETVFSSATKVHVWLKAPVGYWAVDEFKWHYRVFGEKEWIDPGYTEHNYLDLTDLLPNTRYEVTVEVSCTSNPPEKRTYSGEFTMPSDCLTPTLQDIEVQKITDQSAEIKIQLVYPVRFEVRYRVKGSTKNYHWIRGFIGYPLLTELSPDTEYEVQLRVTCDQDSPWTETFYLHTKACDVPYKGRIVVSSITEDSIKAYVEAYDFNPVITGVTYTWQYKPVGSNTWQQIPAATGNVLTLKSLMAEQLYDLQVILRCKNKAQDSIVFTTQFKMTTSKCSTSPDLAWLERFVDETNGEFGFKCNLPVEYSIAYRYWVTNRQNVLYGGVIYDSSTPCTSNDIDFTSIPNALHHFQFRIICPDGNISPWSDVITLDRSDGPDPELDKQFLLPNPTAPNTKLKLWPNPTPGQFQVQIPADASGEALLTVFGADGRKVLTKKVEAYEQTPLELDLSGQAAGLYFIRVQLGKYTFTERVLLQNH